MRKKYKIHIFIIIFLILISKNTYAIEQNEATIDTKNILEEQQSSFGIKEFLNETKKYTTGFLEEIDISDIFNQALKGNIDNKNIMKKILKILGTQVVSTIKILVNILLIVLIHSILKSLTDSLENSDISKIVYYVQYILIVTIIMTNFSDILVSVKETIDNLIGFSQLLIPLLVTLMIYTGSIVSTATIEPILLFLIEFISNMIKTLVLPIISIITVIIIISKITDKIQISKLGNFFKSSIIWGLGVILTLFVGVLSLEGSLTSSVDGVTAKTAKAAVSSLIPVVRKNIRRQCRCNNRMWFNTKKCSGNDWCYCNYWNMHFTNSKTCNI